MSTQHFSLTDAWVKVSEGKVGIQVKEGNAQIYFGTAPPPIDTPATIDLSHFNPVYPATLGYTGTDNGYARAASSEIARIVVIS